MKFWFRNSDSYFEIWLTSEWKKVLHGKEEAANVALEAEIAKLKSGFSTVPEPES